MKAWLLVLLLTSVSSAGAQSITTGVLPDTTRVGDPMRVVLRIDRLPAGTEVMLPDSLTPGPDMENAGRVRITRDSLPDGLTRVTASYPIIVWRPGQTQLDSLSAVLRSADGDRALHVGMPPVNVVSVLPADTTNIQAKPPKDVWGADRIWWPWLLAAALLIALAALIWWWYRRRQRHVEAPALVLIDPREQALLELARIRESGVIERGELKQFYISLSDVLRGFAAALESDWTTDLTTEELAPRLKRIAETAPLLALLRSADTVKFARRRASAEEAGRDLDTAESWIGSFNRRVDAAEAA
jgi:hypothetical protein